MQHTITVLPGEVDKYDEEDSPQQQAYSYPSPKPDPSSASRRITSYNVCYTKLLRTQVTDYPWDGSVLLTIEQAPKKKAFSLYLRVPEWCDHATLKVNGEVVKTNLTADSFAEVNRIWKKGDKVEFVMDMTVKLLESNPLVEETRNQTVVRITSYNVCYTKLLRSANGAKLPLT